MRLFDMIRLGKPTAEMLQEDPDGYPAPGERLTDRETGSTAIVLPRPDKWVPSYSVPIEWADTGVTDVIDMRRLVPTPEEEQ